MFRMNSLRSALRAPFIPKLSPEESNDLQTHVFRTRTSIFALERRINIARTNLLTISRCIKGMLASSGDNSTFFPGIFGVFDLSTAVDDLEESCSQITEDQRDLLRQQELKRSTTFPVPVINRPIIIPDSERIISPPRTLNRTYIATLKMSSEGSYHLLKVKRQEIKLEMERLEADVKRWGDIYAHMTSVESEPQSRGLRPVLSTSTSFSSSQPTLVDSEGEVERRQSLKPSLKGSAWDLHDYERTTSVKRKAVPVQEIVSRTMQRSIPFAPSDYEQIKRQHIEGQQRIRQHQRDPILRTTARVIGGGSLVGALPPQLPPVQSFGMPFSMTSVNHLAELSANEPRGGYRQPALSIRASSETLQGEMRDGRYPMWI